MDQLNYHHLRYFREVAHDGQLTRTAERLNLSQSALSAQLKSLEGRIGHALFDRVERRLQLTEVGRIVLDHADRIFAAGEELVATLDRTSAIVPPLRVGALPTLSRNFQVRFLAPIVARGDVRFELRSGPAELLFEALSRLSLDVVLTTEPPRSATRGELQARLLDEQPVALHGWPDRVTAYDRLRELLKHERFILPTEPAIRAGFAGLVERLQVTPDVAADVDDMAMVRLLAREGVGFAVTPDVVVADELAAGRLQTAPFSLDISEKFYAVTVARSYPHPLIEPLMEAALTRR